MKTFMLFALVGFAAAACPNGCSGNGVCGANDKCSCFQNWQGPDCSGRTCPYALAWADTADGTNSAHYYAECSNKGICDRKTGECKCFDGYEGKGCRRSTCPEGCSGHGTCEYIDELAGDFYDRRTGPGAKFKTLSGTKQGTIVNHDAGANEQALSNSVTDSDNTRQYHGFLYQLWDAQKIQGCKCDLGYSGPDCASRVAPKGDDPLTTVKSTMGVQAIQIDSQAGDFHLVYHDPYGGVWRTDGIAASTDDAVVAKNVQDALRELPNEVLEMVTVAARSGTQTVCHRTTDGAQHIPSANGHGTVNGCASTGSITADGAKVDFDVTFADKPGQTGVQFLLEVNTAANSAAGSFPTHGGITPGAATYTIGEVIGSSDSDLGALSELAECSDRGLDNGDGECECFDGFRGLACEEQEALV